MQGKKDLRKKKQTQKKKTCKCGKEILLLKKHSSDAEKHKQQRQREKIQNSKRDSKKVKDYDTKMKPML